MSGGSRRLFFSAADVRREHKEWGEERWIVNKEYCGKKLLVSKGRRSSMHSHREKDEVLFLDSGSVVLELGDETLTLAPGDFVHVRPGTPHRFTALDDSVMTEFSTTHYDADSHRTEPSGHLEPERFARQRTLIDRFERVGVLVVGDAMLDTFVSGSVDRISPEAPVPVLRVASSADAAGGAGNVARGIAAVCARTTLVGIRGDDAAGEALVELLARDGIEVCVDPVPGRPTTRKTRIATSGGHPFVRVDVEETRPLNPSVEDALLVHVRDRIVGHDVVIVSDYAKGAVSASVLKECIGIGRDAGIPVVVAPKPQARDCLAAARGASVLVANRSEAQGLLGGDERSGPELARMLAAWTEAGAVVTMAESGMAVADGDDVFILPALASDAVDVSGAGDTVVAVLGVALGTGASLPDAADLASRAAAVAVRARGTAAVDPDALRRML